MRFIFALVFFAAALSSPIPRSKAALDQNRQRLDGIAAILNEEIITQSELQTGDDNSLKAKHRALDALIDARLIDQALKEQSDRLAVSDADVDRAIAEVRRLNNLSESTLRSLLAGQGMTWPDYRKKLRDEIARARLIQVNVQSRIQIKDDDVLRYCEEMRANIPKRISACASHILIRGDAGEKQLQAIRKQALLGNTTFAQLAKRHSQDAAAPDGNLGCFGPGQLMASFEEQALALQPGQISKPFQSDIGWHLVLLSSKESIDPPACVASSNPDPMLGPGPDAEAQNPPSKIYQQAQQKIYTEETERQKAIWLGELRQKAYLLIRLPPAKS